MKRIQDERGAGAPRLFINPDKLPPEGELVLDGATHHYLGRVLRLGAGDRVILLDGRGRVCAATVARLDEATAVLQLVPGEATSPRAGQGQKLVLLCGLLKGEKQDFVVQKATELGAARIVPVVCQRSVPQLGEERGEKRQQRWQRIAVAAAQQCRRIDIPVVAPPTPWREALAGPAGALRLLLYEGAAPPLSAVLARRPIALAASPASTADPASSAPAESTADAASWVPGPGAVVASAAAAAEPDSGPPAPGVERIVELLIGPEGGFTAAEVSSAVAAGFIPVSLGPLTLRAETAAVVALGVVQYALSAQAAIDGDSA